MEVLIVDVLEEEMEELLGEGGELWEENENEEVFVVVGEVQVAGGPEIKKRKKRSRRAGFATDKKRRNRLNRKQRQAGKASSGQSGAPVEGGQSDLLPTHQAATVASNVGFPSHGEVNPESIEQVGQSEHSELVAGLPPGAILREASESLGGWAADLLERVSLAESADEPGFSLTEDAGSSVSLAASALSAELVPSSARQLVLVDSHCHWDRMMHLDHFGCFASGTAPLQDFRCIGQYVCSDATGYRPTVDFKMKNMVAVFCDPQTWWMIPALVEDPRIFFTLGIHPQHCGKQVPSTAVLKEMHNLLQHEKCVGLGEDWVGRPSCPVNCRR